MSTPAMHLEAAPSKQPKRPEPRYYQKRMRLQGRLVKRSRCDLGHDLTRDNVLQLKHGRVCRTCENARLKRPDGRPRMAPGTRAQDDPLYLLRRTLLRRYGISYEAYLAMQEAQGGACAICRKTRRLHIDHDHVTGKVRAMLCNNCNTGLGRIEDREFLAAATDYLRRHGSST